MTRRTTFIHTSDFQLGIKRSFLGGEAQARFDDARLTAIKNLGALAEREGAEFIVVAGDVFEANSLLKKTMLRAQAALNNLPVPVYLLPGNHDPLVADSILKRLRGDRIHVIEDSDPVEVVPGVELVGAPYMTKKVHRDLVAQMLGPLDPTETIRVAVGHGQVESRTSEPDPTRIDLGLVEEALSSGTIDYLALGDTHSTERLGTTGAVWFSGAPEVTAFHEIAGDKGERDSGNALVVTIEKRGTEAAVEVTPHRIGVWCFHALDAPLNSEAEAEEFLSRLEEYRDKDCTVIKYALTGTVNLQTKRRLEEKLAEYEEIFAALFPRDSRTDLVVEPEEEELQSLDVQGYAEEVLHELLEERDEDMEARDALNLLFRLAGRGGK
ncbi:metallophosphoesterase family protein [Corynebacterium mastitidis]|uniref:metallophosphoesterase family protein n=1 Tax=Corynebacterium mastitidis TaxID=161890 RepID=UPI0030E80A76